MERTKTETYILGMQAINNFYTMLFHAMKEVMPSAVLRKNGAYAWRGYQIDKYKDLASNLYYCEIYPWEPFHFSDQYGRISAFSCRELVFQEAYKDPAHTPIDDFEEKMCIKTGEYYYPFRVSLDLYRSRFFLMKDYEQYAYLCDFIKYAAETALIWQKSQTRRQVTNLEFLNGKSSRCKIIKNAEEFQKVDVAFLSAWGIQDQLFRRLVTELDPF